MTEQEVVDLIGEALGVETGKVGRNDVAADHPEWDSMGMLALMTMLNAEGIEFDPGDAESLQSVQGVIAAFQSRGKLNP